MKQTPPPTSAPLVARFESLADPARLRLLALLEEHELGVGELAEILQMAQSSVSRHLKLLAEIGWVVFRSEGTANFYTFANGELPPAAGALWRLTRDAMADWPALEHDRLRLARVLAARRTDARAFFAGVASEWDGLRTELYGDRFTLEAIAALLPESAVVADLACGSGAVTALLAPAVGRVVAVDASPEMLRAARVRTKGLGNVELRRGDLAALPVASASCDAALLLLALTHVPEPAAALAEMARILAPGGRAVVVDLLRHDRDAFRRRLGQLSNGFEPDELAGLLAAAGIGAVRCRPLAPEPQAKGPALLLATGTLTHPKRSAPGTRRSRERTPR